MVWWDRVLVVENVIFVLLEREVVVGRDEAPDARRTPEHGI